MPSWLIVTVYRGQQQLAAGRAGALIVQRQREDGDDENEAQAIGGDDRRGANADAVEEPETDSDAEDREHGKRKIVSALRAPDPVKLRDKRQGCAETRQRANEFRHPAFGHSLRISPTRRSAPAPFSKYA